MNNEQPITIKQKLMTIQKAFRTFAVEDESAKKNAKGTSQYKYTPGWKIVESIRSMLDNMSIMLTLNNVRLKNEPITTNVYKDMNGQLVKFEKTEILTTLAGDFQFEDVITGETDGPYHYEATGANGTDKSCASAYSLLERYFFLKHFHITTRELDDEIDAHDTETITGFEAYGAPTKETKVNGFAQPYAAVQQAPLFPQGQQYPQGPQYSQPVQQPYAQTKPAYQATQQPNPATSPVNSGKAVMAMKYANHPDVNAVIQELAQFDRGTPLAMQTLNSAMTSLSKKGYNCTANPDFLGYITETAQAIREGRMPVYA